MKILFVIGTRPEAIKLIPVIQEMKKDDFFKVKICITAQHREMLDQVLSIFEIIPDFDLDLMTENQTLAEITANAIKGLDKIIAAERPDLCIVQGDTTTAFAGALAGFYNGVRIAHVEAGLRTFNKTAPFPEEVNRVLISHISDFHFPPTKGAMANLIAEKIDVSKIFVTGNTVVDTLRLVQDKLASGELLPTNTVVVSLVEKKSRFILVTAHRRENFGEGMDSICAAIKRFCLQYPDVDILFPVHLNPKVRLPVHKALQGIRNVHLTGPLDYISFVAALGACFLVLTDSGGVQEEAPAFQKPVLVMRSTTERPEAMENGLSRLVGTNSAEIYRSLSGLVDNEDQYASMTSENNPFGDGEASKRIVGCIKGMNA